VLELGSSVEALSLTVAIVLLAAYGASLFFSLVTHRELFNPDEDEEEVHHTVWSVKRSVILLAISGLAVGLMAEILVGSIEHTAESVGLSQFFIGAVIVAIVGNAAEHWVAVYVAWKDKMDLAVNIAIGSAAQVALFVGPLLVVLSFFVGPGPLPLAFSAFEIGALLLAAVVASYVTSQGESTWFDGLMLLSVYSVVVATFLFA
jgi:Ca2+:H+ antiporter